MASRVTGDVVNETVLAAIFERAASHRYDPSVYNEDDAKAFECCRTLFSKDYECQVVSNPENPSAHYPAKLIIPVKENTAITEQESIPEQPSSDDSSPSFQAGHYKKMFEASQGCRMNKRFPVPTILWNGKFLSRTGSMDVLSVATDMDINLKQEGSETGDFIFQINIATAAFFIRNKKFFDQMKIDVALLKYLDVNYICDLRVRDTSNSFPNFVHSCETYLKYYVEFTTVHMPYPGLGYFRKYHNFRKPELLSCDLDKMLNGHIQYEKNSAIEHETLSLYITYLTSSARDWQCEVPPPRYKLSLPDIDCTKLYQTDLKKYEIKFKRCRLIPLCRIATLPDTLFWTKWYLHEITLNYLLVLQTYLTSDALPRRGILLHCIAGQDRTPVFVTLLRLSFWADGLMHESLNPMEMLYLTIAYDWYLFGHDLVESLEKGYEIMHFCYNILDRISSDRFSVRKDVEQAARARWIPCCPSGTDRKRKLAEVKRLFLKFYAKIERRQSSLASLDR